MPDLDVAVSAPCYQLADQFIDGASKEDVAEAARLLTLNVAHYQLKYGALPFENIAGMLRTDDIDAETSDLLSTGMQNLVGALGQVSGLADDAKEEPVH